MAISAVVLIIVTIWRFMTAFTIAKGIVPEYGYAAIPNMAQRAVLVRIVRCELMARIAIRTSRWVHKVNHTPVIHVMAA
jgi:hypothetical protein